VVSFKLITEGGWCLGARIAGEVDLNILK
jgi:hypothetical protein